MLKLSRRSLSVLLALCVTSASIAQDQPATPAKEPVVVARYSIASLDALTKFTGDLGIPMPMDYKTQMETAPFLSAGAVATDKPIGMVMIAGDPHKFMPMEDSMAIIVPVNAGKSTPEALAAAGAAAVPGQKDTFTLGAPGGFENFVVHRTANFLVVKEMSSPFGLPAVADDVFASDYKDAANLGVISLNVDAMRKAAPDAYKEVAGDIASLPQMITGLMMGGMGGPPAGNPDDKMILGAMDKINKITLALAQDDVNLHLRYFLSPSPLTAKPREMPRPAFPAGTFFQLHVVYPDATSAGFVEQQLAALPDDDFAAGMPPVYHERMKALALKAAALNTKSDAISAGFGLRDGHPVFYVVDQLSADVDAGKELKDILQEAAGLATEGAGQKMNLEATNYAAGAQQVQHIVLSPDGGPAVKIAIDTLQAGKTVYIAISDNVDGKYVADLPAAGMKGTSSVLCAGALDLGEAFKAASETGGMPGLSPDQLQKLKQAFTGQGVTWTVQSAEAGYLFADLQVPKAALKKLISTFTGTDTQRPGAGLP